MSFSEASPRRSILVIEPDSGSALKLQDFLTAHFQSALDFRHVRSLREGMACLCTHRVSLVLIDLALPDSNGLEAVRLLRSTTPTSVLIAVGCVVKEALLLDAIRAGAHEVLPLVSTSTQEFCLAVDRAMARAGHLPREEREPSPVQMVASPPVLPRLRHDLNNAITSINGFTDLLLARLPAEEPARACAEQIRKAAARAATLVNALTHRPHSSSSLPTTDPTFTAQTAQDLGPKRSN
jgi:CheY-like chemotaxis protein